QVRAAVQSIDLEQPIANVRTMEQWINRSLQPRRAPMTLVTLFGGVALALAAVGIYGVLAVSVGQRARGVGIRQGLGADSRLILALVFAGGLPTARGGGAGGVGGSGGLSRGL